jgi:predicted transcriptional regulator
MARVRLSVDIDEELKKRIKLAAINNDQSIKSWIEQALSEALEREEDRNWLEGDISRLDEIEPYEFQEGDLERGDPVEYVPGLGFVIVEDAEESDEGEQR